MRKEAALLAAMRSVTDLARLCLVLVCSNKSPSHNPEFVTARSPVHRTKTPCS